MICVADFRDLCPRQSRQLLPRSVMDYIPLERHKRVADLSRTLSQTSRRAEMVCVRDFHDLCPQLSPWGSFGENQHNGIWA